MVRHRLHEPELQQSVLGPVGPVDLVVEFHYRDRVQPLHLLRQPELKRLRCCLASL